MNKRDIIISFIVLLIILLTIRANPDSFDGCCFLNYSDVCYGGIEAECIEDEGEFFDGEYCNSVIKCRVMCCCEARSSPSFDIYPIREGTCRETFGGQPISVGQQECDLICGQVTDEIPLCKENCKLNEQDCVGRGGEIVDVSYEGGYYCWDNNESYKNRDICEGICNEVKACVLGAEIESSCYCGGNLYDSGFCCWDNSYTPDVSGSDCPLANECERYPEGGPYYKCCDACLDESFTYPVADYDGSNDRCPQNSARCCEECAPDKEGCCEYEWQCGGSILGYNYYSCPFRFPCDESCLESICILNERINSGANPYPMCLCNEEYYNTSTDSRYCCLDGVSNLPCEANTFKMQGYVYNIDTSNKISNADVITKVKVGIITELYTTKTDGDGGYVIENIKFGAGKSFNVTVIKRGYIPTNFIVEYPIGETKNQNFNITAIEDVCGEINAPPVTAFDANPIKGKKELELIWEGPASVPSEIVGYFVGRDMDFDLGTFYISDISFIDEDVEWEETYTYDIAVLYSSGGISQKTFTSITTGDEDCEGIFDNNEFCLDNRRKQCDENNMLVLDLECAPGYICMGPDEKGKTYCKKEVNCREKGNPFGLFCTGAACLDDDDPCYYDYSDTTVDECGNCSYVSDCYGYISEDACLTDNCLISGAYSFEEDNSCEWHYMFEEFGKGFCYDEDYNGLDYCWLCNKDSDVFYNVNCDQNVCTKLGACHSSDLSCEPCFDTTTCEDFDNEYSCVNAHLLGSRNVTIGENLEIIGSDDACGLGRCKWGDPDGDGKASCFKDADDDDLADCKKGNVLCEDFEAFITKPQPDIPRMNANGYGITFFLEGGGMGSLSDFYFCIDENNSCIQIGDVDVNPADRVIIINPVEETDIIDDVGNYFIRYYSIDSNKNVEEVKSTPFFVDPIFPVAEFGHKFYSEGGHNYTEIAAAFDECVRCNYELNSIPLDKVEEHNLDVDGNEFFIKFKDLDDGNYIFTTICSDDVGNSVRNDYSFYVDFVHGINIGYPNSEVLNTEKVKFYLTTADDCDCVLEAIDASSFGIPYDALPGEPIMMNKVEMISNKLYNYTTTLTLGEDRSYIVKATCTPLVSGEVDYGFFHFTIDTQAPVTLTDFDFGAWHRKEEDLITIDFDCNDIDINGTPGESGCKAVYLCTGLNCHSDERNYQELVNKEYQTNVNGLYVSYFSVDNLGNKENRYVTGHYNQRIRIDEVDPTCTIVEPIGTFTNKKEQRVRVNAKDLMSGIAYVNVEIEEVDPLRRKITANATRQGNSDVYSLDVELYPGQNLITATVCDYASNCMQDTHQIYVDIYSPYIGDIIILDSDFDLDENNIFEYRENLSFSIKIEDKYLHPGNNMRYGVGVEKANINIYDESGGLITAAAMVAGEENYYYTKILGVLSVGRYSANIEAYDYYDNFNNKLVFFEVKDTKPITLYLEPDIEDDSTVYVSDLTLTGITDPGIKVDTYICDSNCITNCGNIVASDIGEMAYVKEGFNNKQISELITAGDYPKAGDTQLVFEGMWGGQNYIEKKDFLKFSSYGTFYEVEDISIQYYGPGGYYVTIIEINPGIQENILEGSVSAYESDKPEGFFELKDVSLRGGGQCIVVVAKRTESGRPAEIKRKLTYVAAGLNIQQKTPERNAMLYDSNLNSFRVEVTTDYPADCTIINPEENGVAKQFSFSLTPSGDRKTHSIVFDNSYCREPVGSGPFCYLNNDASRSGGVYHQYTVNCVPHGINMASESKTICFGVASWYEMSGTQYGVNICKGATGCSGGFISSCVSCTPNCEGKECGSNGCGGSCGSCEAGKTKCVNYECIPCTPNCEGKECGSDDCGGSCGSCLSGEECLEGECKFLMGGKHE